MANRIKGITVEIGGDVTGLDKALKTVNKTIKDTQSQLKDVERLLKLDPTNTELIAQKQRLLGDAVGATKEKLEQLKAAQEQAKQQMESGNLGREKYEALQREIIETEQDLEKLADEAGKANAALIKIGDTGQTIENIGGKISNVGSGLTKYVTGPIAAIGAASMAAFGEVDSAIDSMITKTGAAGESLEQMETAVQNIATSIPTDFQTAADAVGEVSIRFDDVGDNLELLSKYFVEFAAIANTDVVTAVDNVQSSMAAFGLKTNNAYFVLDMLTAAAQETGTDVNQLTSMITQNAGAMKEMGFSYQDTAFFLANLNKNGVDASSVMTGLKKAWQTASKDGKSMQDVLGELSTKIISASSDTEAYQAAIEIFGAKAGPAIAQAMRDGRLSLDEFGYSLQEFDDTMATTFYDTLDPIDQTTLMMNELKLVGADLASTAQEMLMPVLETLREKLQQLREWWSGLSEEQQKNIIKFAGIAAAIGPVLMGIGNLTSSVGKGMQAFSSMGLKLSSLITKTQAGVGPLASLKGAIAGISAPVLAVVAAIGVLIAAFTNLWKNNEEFRTKVTAIWDGVKKKFEDFAKGIQDRLAAVGVNFETITETIKKIWDGFCEALAPVFEGAFELISNALSSALDVITGLFDVFIGIFTGDWDQAWLGVQEIFSGYWESIKGTVETVLETIKGVINVFLGWFGTDWDTAWETAKSTVSNVWESISGKITSVMDSIKGYVSTAIENIKGLFNFSFEIPHIPMPHFSIQPPGWQIGDLLKGSIPSLGIDWYAKAMNNGMILDGPTIFGMQGNQLLAGGEKGSETVVGTNSLMGMIQKAVNNTASAPQITFDDLNVYVESHGTDAVAIADEIGAELSRKLRMAGGW